jgi:hypothetical protein
MGYDGRPGVVTHGCPLGGESLGRAVTGSARAGVS